MPPRERAAVHQDVLGMEPSSEQERVRGDEASRESIVPPRKRAACRPAPVHHSRARAVCIAGPVLVSAQNAYLLPGSPGGDCRGPCCVYGDRE